MYEVDYQRRRRKPWGCLTILSILAIVLGLLLLWLHSLIQPYSSFSYNTRVAQIRVVKAHVPHRMSVELRIVTNDGHVLSDNFYPLPGDEWKLEGDMINILGFYTGYKLTHLVSRYNSEGNAAASVIDINGGDDDFFKTLSSHPTPVAAASQIMSSFLPPDGKTYGVLVSQTGLLLNPSS